MTVGAHNYSHAGHSPSHAYLWRAFAPALERELGPGGRIFEVGCGNGSMTATMAAAGYQVTAIEPSESGIALARESNPGPDFHVGSAYDDLAGRFGRFPVVVSMEVVEHLMEPRRFARAVFGLLEPGGLAVISTPFHGYWKNLAIALAGGYDKHFHPLVDGGHVKFWSEATLRALLEETGFRDITFTRAGRIAPLANSMVAFARRPS